MSSHLYREVRSVPWTRTRARTPALVFFAVVVSWGFDASGAPQYIEDESPIVDTLSEVPSTTDRIGITPNSNLTDSEPFPMHTPEILPRLRAEHVPESGLTFLDETNITLRPRFFHQYRDLGNGVISEATATGGALAAETGWLSDSLRFTFAGYTSQKLYGPKDRDGTGLLRAGQESYTVLGEAFAELRLDQDTSFSAGRLPLDLPFINRNDSRMTPNTFRAFGFRTLAIPKLQVGGGYVDRIKFRNQSRFEPLSVRAGAPGTDRGVAMIGARYNFSDEYYLGLVEEYGLDMFNTLYLESDRLISLSDDLELRIGGQIADQRSTGDEIVGDFASRSYGARLELGYHGLIFHTSVTKTNGDGIRKPWGGSPSFNSSMISDFDRAGEQSVQIGASWDLSRIGLENLAASAGWIHGDTPDHGPSASPDQREFNLTIDYRPEMRLLENTWLRVRYATNERNGLDTSDFRVILNYSISF